MSRVATVFVVVALLLSGCSGFSNGADSTPPSSTSVTTEDQATATPSPSDLTSARTTTRASGVFLELTRARWDVTIDGSVENESTKYYENLSAPMRTEFDEALQGEYEVQRSWNGTVRYVKYDEVWFEVRRHRAN